jgi:transcriptional regulator with XRE-family HTH domain
MSRLSEPLVLAANKKGLTARKIALAAKAAGFTLNHDTAARYLRGDHGRPSEATLRALSAVLDVPMKVLREAADLPAEETQPYQPPSESSRLTRRQRRAVDEIIRAMLEPAEQHLDELDQRRARARSKAARRGQIEPPNH